MKNIEVIRQFSIFADISSTEFEALHSALEFINVRKNTYIVREGANDSNLYFLLSGEIRVFRTNKVGKELTLAEFKPGSYFGEIGLLTENVRTANVLALSKCELARLSKVDFDLHIKKHKGLTVVMLKEMAQRLRLTTGHISDFAFLDLTKHLLKLLKTISVKVEFDGDKVDLVRESPSHKDLAAKLNATREAITRALRKLENEGLISRVEQQIFLYY